MRRLRGIVIALSALSLPALAVAVPGSEQQILVAGGPRPAILDSIDAAGLLALALGPGEASAAAAYADPRSPNRTLMRLYSIERSQPLEETLPGVVRSVLFSPVGDEVLVILHKPAKKRLGDSTLVRIDLDTAKSRSIMRLPASAAALTYSARRDSLLVAATNEIRTVRVDGWRSGPLFRVTGSNLAIVALPGSDAVLVGQVDGVILVRLADKPGEEGLPVRDRATLPAAVDALAVAPDGRSVLARLRDGQVYRIDLAPISVEPAGKADVLVQLPEVAATTPVSLPPLPVPSPAPGATTPTATPPQAPPAPVEHAQPSAEAPPARETPAATPPPQSPPPVAETKQEPTPSPPPAPPPAGAPQVWGRLTGKAVDAVDAIVLLGPDNVLREATRVRPQADGTWRADGLAPGRYQIQLVSGADTMLVSEPPAAIVELVAGRSVEAPEFRVLQARRP